MFISSNITKQKKEEEEKTIKTKITTTTYCNSISFLIHPDYL